MSKRIGYFDVLRGIAIICVVAIHASTLGLQFSNNSFNFHFTLLSRQILNVSVPLFIVISGYFLANKNVSNLHDYFDFIKKQIQKIYIPFFVWSSVWFIIGILIFKKSIFYEFFNLITFQSHGTYYFIALIIQYYILLPILKHLANLNGLIISLAISLFMVGIIFYIQNYIGMDLPLIIYAGNFIILLVFFVLGLYLGSIKKITISNKLLIGLILVFYTLSCLESYFLYSLFKNAGLAATLMKPSSFMFSLFFIIYLFKNIDLFKSSILEYLGGVSFGIYLIHMFVLIIVSRVLSIFFTPLLELQVLYQFILVTIIILSCFFIIWAAKKIFPDKLIKIVGFK